jgi:hypothetical protein
MGKSKAQNIPVARFLYYSIANFSLQGHLTSFQIYGYIQIKGKEIRLI